MPLALDTLLDRLMHIHIERMGGAVTGIEGTTGAEVEVINSLKMAARDFAIAYKAPTPDQSKLEELADTIRGYLETLNVLTVLSEKETSELLGQLSLLVDDAATR